MPAVVRCGTAARSRRSPALPSTTRAARARGGRRGRHPRFLRTVRRDPARRAGQRTRRVHVTRERAGCTTWRASAARTERSSSSGVPSRSGRRPDDPAFTRRLERGGFEVRVERSGRALRRRQASRRVDRAQERRSPGVTEPSVGRRALERPLQLVTDAHDRSLRQSLRRNPGGARSSVGEHRACRAPHRDGVSAHAAERGSDAHVGPPHVAVTHQLRVHHLPVLFTG